MIKSSEISDSRTIDGFIDQLKQCKALSEVDVGFLCDKAKEIFMNEDNIVNVPAPVTV